jgi:hypothetical protein
MLTEITRISGSSTVAFNLQGKNEDNVSWFAHLCETWLKETMFPGLPNSENKAKKQ